MFSFSFIHYVHKKINKGERKTNVKKKKGEKKKNNNFKSDKKEFLWKQNECYILNEIH